MAPKLNPVKPFEAATLPRPSSAESLSKPLPSQARESEEIPDTIDSWEISPGNAPQGGQPVPAALQAPVVEVLAKSLMQVHALRRSTSFSSQLAEETKAFVQMRLEERAREQAQTIPDEATSSGSETEPEPEPVGSESPGPSNNISWTKQAGAVQCTVSVKPVVRDLAAHRWSAAQPVQHVAQPQNDASDQHENTARAMSLLKASLNDWNMAVFHPDQPDEGPKPGYRGIFVAPDPAFIKLEQKQLNDAWAHSRKEFDDLLAPCKGQKVWIRWRGPARYHTSTHGWIAEKPTYISRRKLRGYKCVSGIQAMAIDCYNRGDSINFARIWARNPLELKSFLNDENLSDEDLFDLPTLQVLIDELSRDVWTTGDYSDVKIAGDAYAHFLRRTIPDKPGERPGLLKLFGHTTANKDAIELARVLAAKLVFSKEDTLTKTAQTAALKISILHYGALQFAKEQTTKQKMDIERVKAALDLTQSTTNLGLSVVSTAFPHAAPGVGVAVAVVAVAKNLAALKLASDPRAQPQDMSAHVLNSLRNKTMGLAEVGYSVPGLTTKAAEEQPKNDAEITAIEFQLRRTYGAAFNAFICVCWDGLTGTPPPPLQPGAINNFYQVLRGLEARLKDAA